MADWRAAIEQRRNYRKIIPSEKFERKTVVLDFFLKRIYLVIFTGLCEGVHVLSG